jgi:hypothetical protein
MAFQLSLMPQGRWNIIPTERENVSRDIDVPPVQFKETQAGLRIGTQFDDLDVSLFAYVGRDAMPGFVPELIFVGGEQRFQLVITDTYPRIRSGGFNASYPLGDALLLRTEVVYFSSPDEERDDFLHSVIGAEYSLADWRFVLNYFRDDVVTRADVEVTDKGERRFFQSFLFGEVRYDAGGRLSLLLRGGIDFSEEFLVIEPEIDYRVWRDLHIAITANIVDGSGDNYFERIQSEDRIGTRLRYYF